MKIGKLEIVGILVGVLLVSSSSYLMVKGENRKTERQNEKHANEVKQAYNQGWSDAYVPVYKQAVIDMYYEKSQYVLQNMNGDITVWKQTDHWVENKTE